MFQTHINKVAHLGDFVRLNEEWISRYFSLEEADFALRKDPEKIIRTGGRILSVTSPDRASETSARKVLGVCALWPAKGEGTEEKMEAESNVYELARMAVELVMSEEEKQ